MNAIFKGSLSQVDNKFDHEYQVFCVQSTNGISVGVGMKWNGCRLRMNSWLTAAFCLDGYVPMGTETAEVLQCNACFYKGESIFIKFPMTYEVLLLVLSRSVQKYQVDQETDEVIRFPLPGEPINIRQHFHFCCKD